MALKLCQGNALLAIDSGDLQVRSLKGEVGTLDPLRNVDFYLDIKQRKNILDDLCLSVICRNGVDHVQTVSVLFGLVDHGSTSCGADGVDLECRGVTKLSEQIQKIFAVVYASVLTVRGAQGMTIVNDISFLYR